MARNRPVRRKITRAGFSKGYLVRERILRVTGTADDIELETFSPTSTSRALGCAIEDIPNGSEVDSWTIYFVKKWV